MDDLKLLEKFEPVLRFAKSERFFPMAVEPYFERCMIFPSEPHGAGELFSHLNEPLVDKVGRLGGHEYFLRFVQYHRQLGGRNWFKSGMNHAQTGNLLENLSQ